MTSPFKIAIASGKGGTGKTLISTNLATLMSETQKTLLVDLDVEEPNDFIFIKGETQKISDQYKMIPTWEEKKCIQCGTCAKNCKFHAVVQLGTFIAVFNELCHSCFACSELCPTNSLPMQKHKMGEITTINAGHLVFLESRLNVGEEQAVPLIHQTHELVNQVYSDTEIQIFDCPPGTSCPVVAATKETDFVVLVTEPTPFGLNDLRLAVETMRMIKNPIGVIINRYGIGNKDVENYCQQEQIPILAMIPFDKEIAKSYSNGDLIYKNNELVKVALEEMMLGIHKICDK